MELYNLKCPNCGATLATDVKNKYAKCEYCGNEFVISDNPERDTKPFGCNRKEDTTGKEPKLPEKNPVSQKSPVNPEEHKKSHSRDFLLVFLFVVAGLALSFFFDKEKPHDIVPKTDLHRFFMELRLDSTPQDIETLTEKHKLHYFRSEKAVNSPDANIIFYKVAKTNETALGKQGAHAETVEIEFDLTKNNAFRLAVYADPDHIVSRALLFNYGTYYSLSAKEAQAKNVAGYYYYNNSLRGTPDEQKAHPPYLKCADAMEALKKIYTYRK